MHQSEADHQPDRSNGGHSLSRHEERQEHRRQGPAHFDVLHVRGHYVGVHVGDQHGDSSAPPFSPAWCEDISWHHYHH